MALALRLALRYVRRRTVAALSLTAVAGAVLIAYVPSPVMEGWLAVFRENLRTTGGDVQVEILCPRNPELLPEAEKILSGLPGIVAFAPRAEAPVGFLTQDDTQEVEGGFVIGMDPPREERVTTLLRGLDPRFTDPGKPFEVSRNLREWNARWVRAAIARGRAAAERDPGAFDRALLAGGGSRGDEEDERQTHRALGEEALRDLTYDDRLREVLDTPLDDWDPKLRGQAEAEPDRLRLTTGEKLPGVLLGEGMLRRWPHLRVGGEVTLWTGEIRELDPKEPDRERFTPRSWRFLVTGVFRTGFHEVDLRLLLADLPVVRAFVSGAKVADGFAVRTVSPDEAPAVREAAKVALKPIEEKIQGSEGREGAPPMDLGRSQRPVLVKTTEERRANLLQAVNLQKQVLLVVLFIGVLVAGLGILVTLRILVAEKTRDIGVLAAMGCPPSGLLAVFVCTGALVGFLGSVLGVAGGLLVVGNADAIVDGLAALGWDEFRVYLQEVQHLSKVPVRNDPGAIVRIVLATVFSAIVFSLEPAWRAARLRPVDAIRRD
ncbi:MAG: FtsX-like permease family protein [Planctomycetales bacterium]|nr:FtsX-like permease family protein [Planctomycetales bacterium]